MKTYKSIAYAYPTSPAADKFGMPDGAFYVQQTLIDIEGSGQCKTFPAHNGEGYKSACDPDLIAFYHECEGEIDPNFLKHGNAFALSAIRNSLD